MHHRSSAAGIALLAFCASNVAMAAPMTVKLPPGASGPSTIEVQSWSWGTSHPRNLATGQEVELALALPAGADSGVAPDACAAGIHYQKIEVTWQQRVMQLADAVLSCDAPSAAAAVVGKQKQWLVSNFRLRGHVTLIK